MNIKLPFLPERPGKPRETGLTMMMDKGLSIREAESFVEAAGEYADLIKLAFGTGVFAKNIEAKIKLYRQAGIRVHFGGTLFEAFIVRNHFDEFRHFLDRHGMDTVEVSDGSMTIPHDKKLEYIRILSQQTTVLSEVGSKMQGVVITPDSWVDHMKSELEAGAWKVIAEARESGTIGIYHSDGSADRELIAKLDKEIGHDNILWEAPNKNQQVWFIKQFGSNVNLGNIATNEVVALESLRLGLRGDTFFEFLPDELQHLKQI
ncbi:MAG: phosphosulfolactate synthase [Bacteroidales bacterium]|jgi:phosphosulfolactate synthase|nr:phosphosulfolactate synthase [Bacteroidales bacterium]